MDTVNRGDNGRDSRGRFTKGNKGGGRPAIASDFRKRCREFMEADGWRILIDMASDPKAKEQRYALELIAAYAYGRPKQGVELSGPDGAPVQIDLDTAALVRKARELASKADGGK